MKKIITKIFLFLLFFVIINIFTFEIYGMQVKDDGNYPKGVTSTENSNLFGNSIVSYSSYYDKDKKITEDNYKNSYIELDKYYYIIFKYNKPLDAPIKYLSGRHKVIKGNSLSITYTQNETITETYEESLKSTLTTIQAVKFDAGISLYDIFKASGSVSTSVSNSIESSISFSKAYSISKGYSITTNVSSRDYDSYWYYLYRARFNVYKICVYEVVYDTTTTTKKTWYGKKYNNYSYKFNSCKLIEESYRYSYIDNTMYDGLFEYGDMSNGLFKLKMNKNSNYTYLD